MKRCLSVLLLFSFAFGYSQKSKPAIDSAAIANWSDLLFSEAAITNDGKYFTYNIKSSKGRSKIFIQQINGSWKKEIVGIHNNVLSSESNQVIYQRNDTLFFQSLGKDELTYITDVKGYDEPYRTTNKWFVYQFKKNNELVVRNQQTGKEQRYSAVSDYSFDKNGKALLLKTNKDNSKTESLQWIDLSTGTVSTIWSPQKDETASGYRFDEVGKQLVFVVQEKMEKELFNSVWYYNVGMDKAVMKVSNQSPGIDSGLVISSAGSYFNKNGKYLFFKLEPLPEPPLPKPDTKAVQVDVWSYKDMVLQHSQLLELQKTGKSTLGIGIAQNQFAAVVPVAGNKIVKLENNDEALYNVDLNDHNFFLSWHVDYTGDKWWIKPDQLFYLGSLKDGSRKFITKNATLFTTSPSGKYLVYWNFGAKQYFSYNLFTGKSKAVSENIKERLTMEDLDEQHINNAVPVGIAGWLDNDELMVYDSYDIWKIDPAGIKPPLNLTNGYGRHNHIKFRLIPNEGTEHIQIHPHNKPLLLSAFNTENKYNGFFAFKPGKFANPELLTMGPYNYYTNGQSQFGSTSMKPLKAAKANVWIIKRQTASDAPNFFGSSDLKTFKQLTNNQPHKAYNWLTTELVNWTSYDGKPCQGILYKPEDFDSNKKYPVIINCYEKLSQNLYQFMRPGFIDGDINIPLIVSRGYLVFTPDIHYTIHNAGESVVNCVESGAIKIFQLPFVDSTKVGLQGHSFGGYETNYLITRSHLFAAAVEGAGASNFTSYFGTMRPSERGSFTTHSENGGQYRLECLLCERPEVYIENSPLFNADKVTTPLLMMHNKMDDNVPWPQAVEFFTALRRFNKPVWMLQYDKSGHGAYGKDAIDYTKRIIQFFDHFLKAAPAPKWMTNGIPAKLKGIDNGFNIEDK